MSIQQEDPLALLSERVEYLEDGFKLYRSRQDALGKEVKVMLAEIHIITEWIHQKFGVELINKNSFLYKHIHDFEEVQEISATLCLLANVAINATKYTGAELAAAAAAAAAGNAAAAAAAQAAANSNQDHSGRGGGGYTGSSSPVSPSPHRIRISALPPPPEHPPRPISTPPMISGQQLYHHQQHALLIPQQGSPAPAHTTSIHHVHPHHHSNHPPPHSPHPHHNSPPHQQIHLHHIQQLPPSSNVSVQHQHHSQYILPHSPTSTSAPSKLSPQNLPPPHSSSSPNSPTNLSQSQLIISKKSKAAAAAAATQLTSASAMPPTTKILLPPPPPPPIQTSTGTVTSGKNTIPATVVTLIAPSASPTSQLSPPQPYQHHHSSLSSSTPTPVSQPVTVHVQQQQPPPPPITPTVTHISVPPKKSLSSRNAHNLSNCAAGSANITKYFKPVQHQLQQSSSKSSSRPPSPPLSLHDQKPSLTTGTLVESHATIGQVYIFSETNEHTAPIIVNNVDVVTSGANTIPPPVFKRDPASVEIIDVDESVGTGDNGLQIRPTTPINTILPIPDPEVHRPKRRNRTRKKGYGKGGSNRNISRGRSPNHNTNSLDYTADTEDEVPSARDSTPVSVISNKRKMHESPKPLKTSTPITTTPKSSKIHHSLRSSTPIPAAAGPPSGITESPIPGPSHAIGNFSSGNLSNSSSRHQSGGEESSSTGTSEKLPKRGRPKKRPEERVRTYDPRVPMQCDECGKVLKGTGALRVHKQIHQNIRPYDCTVCGRAFRRKHHLEFHMMIHEGNKKETCSYCGKAFLIRRDLARHERTHTGEKPYSCNLCPKSFNVKQHLTLHIRTHTGERPYRCPICDKTFTQANSLRIHKKIHLRDRERAEGGAGTGAGNAGSGGGTGSGGTGGGGKGGKSKGGARNSSTSSNSTNSNASNSSNSSSSSGGGALSSSTTSGISSGSTSALETPDRTRPPSSGGGGSRAASPSPSLRSGQSSPPSPAVRQHPLLQHVHIPPPVAETVTVVTSPPGQLSGHTFDGGRGEQQHTYHGAATITSQPSSPPTTWRLSLNPGSGTNLISPPGANRDGRSPPPPTFTIPAAHQVQPTAGGNPGHYAVIRNVVPVTASPGPTLVRTYISPTDGHLHGGGLDPRSTPSPATTTMVGNTVPAHNHIHHGQSPPGAATSAPGAPGTFTIYDPNVTRYYN